MRHSDLFVELGLCLRMFIVVMWNQMLLPACPWVSTQGWASQLCSLSTQDDSGRLLVYNDSFISTWYIVLSCTVLVIHVMLVTWGYGSIYSFASQTCWRFLHYAGIIICTMSLQQIRIVIMRWFRPSCFYFLEGHLLLCYCDQYSIHKFTEWVCGGSLSRKHW